MTKIAGNIQSDCDLAKASLGGASFLVSVDSSQKRKVTNVTAGIEAADAGQDRVHCAPMMD